MGVKPPRPAPRGPKPTPPPPPPPKKAARVEVVVQHSSQPERDARGVPRWADGAVYVPWESARGWCEELLRRASGQMHESDRKSYENWAEAVRVEVMKCESVKAGI